jgi:hypothetical protein
MAGKLHASSFLNSLKLQMEGGPGQVGLGYKVTREMAIDHLQKWMHDNISCRDHQMGCANTMTHVRIVNADDFVDDSEEWLTANGLGLPKKGKEINV